jgi:hypothetical protein
MARHTRGVHPPATPVPAIHLQQKMLAEWPVSCRSSGVPLARSHRQMCRSSEPLTSSEPVCRQAGQAG